LETCWKQCQQISVVYLTFEKQNFRWSYINTRDESHEIRPSVQHLHVFIHSRPSIQYLIVGWITAVMIFLTDNILVTDRDAFYQMKTYTISSTWGSSRQHTATRTGRRLYTCSAIGILRNDAKRCKVLILV
jgi:hypothetical protein